MRAGHRPNRRAHAAASRYVFFLIFSVRTIRKAFKNGYAETDRPPARLKRPMVSRHANCDAFPLSMTAAQFVSKLDQNAGGVLSQMECDRLVSQLSSSADVAAGRASVLRQVSADPALKTNEFNRAFVLMQYYGYPRRNPDHAPDSDFRGGELWLDKLNQFNRNFVQAEMVKA